MSRLRAAAAALVDHGRVLGRAEGVKATLDLLRILKGLAPDGQREAIDGQLRIHEVALGDHEFVAKRAAAAAAALVAELEHPGARLARRVLATGRAARAAWRASR